LLPSRKEKEKEKQVIKLDEEGKTTREIAKEVHISLKYIGKIIRKETGADTDGYTKRVKKEKEKEVEKQKWLKSRSPYAKAFQMFKERRTLADVTIELDIKSDSVLDFYKYYLRLVRTNDFMIIYNELKNDLPIFIHLHRQIKNEKITKQDITDLLQNPQRLRDGAKS
jgi:transposase